MIIADKREKNSLVVAELVNLGMKVELKQLNVADYLIGNIAIERKSASDFVSSMINKRLVRQLQELRQYEKCLLIIEGDIYSTNMNHNALKGMLLSIAIDFKVPIIFSDNDEETALFISLLEKRQEKEPKEISLVAKKKAFSLAEQQQIILENFPGIGPATAKMLLKEFKTLKAVMNASKKKLQELIGKKAENMKRIVDSVYQE